tara:strand:- start:6679 stop:7329 length:651 start_codon:yes stop_codon:yes gene_type:complete
MTEYKILKLKSGESIIAKIRTVDKDKGSVILDRPMSLKTIAVYNELGLGAEEKVVIRRYADFSNDQFVEIPTNYVVSVLSPSDRTVEIYDREKIFEDNPQLRFIARKKEEQQALADFLEKQKRVREIAEQMGFDVDDMEDEEGRPPTPADFSALMLPNDAIRQLLEMMGLEWNGPSFDDEIEEEITPESLDTLEPDPEDWPYGTRWQDWDIEDFTN